MIMTNDLIHEHIINRERIIALARAKYIDTGTTRNITDALRLYLADAPPNEQIPLWITSPEIHQIRKILEQIRPTCDDCGTELHLQIKAQDPSDKTYPTAWCCKVCGMIYYSDKTPAEWLEELQDETRKQNLQKSDESGQGNMPTGRQSSKI